MAVDQRNLPAFLSGDADFRTWGSGIAAQIAAMGLIKTADTGQIDWVTVARPGAINTVAGYEVYRFADALQATLPCFIKVEYGVAGAVDRPSLWITVGTATNGAGTITGQAGTRKQTGASGSKTAAAVLPSYCSGDTSRLTLVTNLDASSSSFAFVVNVERPKTVADVEDSGCLYTLLQGGGGGGGHMQVIPSTGTVPTVGATGTGIVVGLTGHISNRGGNVALGPFGIVCGDLFFSDLLLYTLADIAELATIAVTHLGSAKTYMPIGDGFPNLAGIASAATGVAILWE